MRMVILHLFERYCSNNEEEYKSVLNVIFGDRIPQKMKNFPSFSEKQSFEENLNYHYLTEEGKIV